ncbi:MAG: hypothetical protein GXW89_15185 [Phycisphaerae bacterium]|nr:hypothetical protein [Phycisphaerae bacterium]
MRTSMLLIIGVWAFNPLTGLADEAPVRIPAGQAQLFVDDELIATQDQLERTLHTPIKDQGGNVPVLEAPEGTTYIAYGSIVYDRKLEKYVMLFFERGKVPAGRLCRYVSRDGLQWENSSPEERERLGFNVSVEPEAGHEGRKGFDLFSFYYDAKDPKAPYKGWIYLANYGLDREGVYYTWSPDGISWEVGAQVVNAYAGEGDTSCVRIRQDGKTVWGPGDVTLMAPDPETGTFVGLFKFYDPRKGVSNGLRSRTYLRLNRLDEPVDLKRFEHIELLPPLMDTGADTRHDEYYASTAWRYGPLWLGELKVIHFEGDYPWSKAGAAFMKLLVSRDGVRWKKVPFRNEWGYPEVFIPNGIEGGNHGRNDGGYMSMFSQGPLRIGDELVFYYSSTSWGRSVLPASQRVKGGGIFRARLRPDGFVSVSGGTLTTRPLACEGNELYVNGVGPIEVAVLDAEERVLGEAAIEGDSLKHRVRFGGKSLGLLGAGGAIRLRFKGGSYGRLYSFTVGDEGQ